MKNLKARIALTSSRTVIFEAETSKGTQVSQVIVFPNAIFADEVVARINRMSNADLEAEVNSLREKVKSLSAKIDEE